MHGGSGAIFLQLGLARGAPIYRWVEKHGVGRRIRGVFVFADAFLRIGRLEKLGTGDEREGVVALR